MLKIRLYYFIFSIIFLSYPIFSQNKQQKAAFIDIQPINISNPSIEKLLQEKITVELQNSGFTVNNLSSKNIDTNLELAAKTENSFYINLAYTKESNDSNVNIYVQVYDPTKKQIIDAYSITDEIFQTEGLQLDKNELKESDLSRITKIAKRIPVILRSNPNKKENRSNIDYYLTNKELTQKLKKYLSSDEKSQAQAAADVFDILQAQVTVSATKIAKKTNEAPNIVSVISNKELEDYGRISLNDVLYQLPGFASSQVNERRTVSARGMFEGWNNNHLLMLVDGVQFNELFYGSAFTWEITPLNMIKSLEVIRGPGSALYGSNATNGVTSLNTFSGSDLNGEARVRIRAGSLNTRIYDILTGNKGKIFSHVVSYNSFETNGLSYKNYDLSGRKDDFGFLKKFQYKDERNNYYLFLKLEGEDFLKGLSFQYHRQKWNYNTFDGWLNFVPDTYERHSEYRDVFVAKYTNNLTDKLIQEYVLKINDGNWDLNVRSVPASEENPYGVSEILKTRLNNLFFRSQWTYLFSGGANIVTGIELNRTIYHGDKFHLSNINMNLFGEGAINPNGIFLPLNPYMEWILDKPVYKFAPFFQWATGRILDKKVELTFGIRSDESIYHFRGIDQPYKEFIGRPYLENPDTLEVFQIPNKLLGPPFITNEKKVYRKTSPRVGLVFFPTDRLTLKAMVGRAFREPALGEIFGANTYIGSAGNPRKMSPEVIKTSEFGVDWSITPKYNLRTNVFDTRFENAIDYGEGSNALVNLFTLGTRGVEAELLANHKYFSYFINYSRFFRYLDRNLDPKITTHPREVTLAPGHTINAGVNLEINKFQSSLSIQRQGRVSRKDSDLGPIDPITRTYYESTYSNPYSYPVYRPKRVPAWVNINFKLSYKISENIKLGFQVFNLTNSYQSLVTKGDNPYDYIREGRRYMLDLQVNF